MYPKPILQDLLKTPQGATLFADEFATSIHVSRQLPAGAPNWVEDWMLACETTHGSVHSYLDFLRRTLRQFNIIAEKMGYWNPDASHSLGHDKWSVGWAGVNLLSMAAYLYILKSHGVTGCVLECGAYKGSSTACLSWVCSELGLQLYSADSFAGLPSNEGHYNAGDFRGTLDEVVRNVSEYGCLDAVQFIPGWYAESLKNFGHNIMLLWVDVDLQQSVLDVMGNVFSHLDRNGVIFSDGFTVGVDFDGFKIRHTGSEPAGFVRFFEKHGINYKAILEGASGLAIIVPNCRDEERIIFQPDAFRYLVERL